MLRIVTNACGRVGDVLFYRSGGEPPFTLISPLQTTQQTGTTPLALTLQTRYTKTMNNTLPPMFSVYYSDDEHDHFFIDSPSLFEATCELYYMMDDLEGHEWITIRDENDNIITDK